MSIMKQNVIKLGLSYWLINNVKHVYGEPFGSRKSRLSTVRRAIRAASRKGAENPLVWTTTELTASKLVHENWRNP